MFCIFNQISYDLTGSLTRNKDSLPQNLLFTLKCKWPMNNRPTVASPHTSRNPLGPTACRNPLQESLCFAPVSVSTRTEQTVPSVCILSIEGTRCGVLWSVRHRRPLCGCQAHGLTSIIVVIPMMKLIMRRRAPHLHLAAVPLSERADVTPPSGNTLCTVSPLRTRGSHPLIL